MALTAPQRPISKVPNYRKIVRQALPDKYFRPDFSFLLWIPVHLAIIGASLWVLSAHFNWRYAPFLSILIGHSFGCLGFIAHGVSHGQAFPYRWQKELVAGICFSPFAIGPLLWRKWHNAEHHNNTQVAGIDPDHLFTMETYSESHVLRSLYKLHPVLRNLVIFSSFSFRMTQHSIRMLTDQLPKVRRREQLMLLAQFVLPLALWIGLTASLGWKVLIWGYFVPMLVANALVISYIATNHFLNPLADESDVLGTSLSVTLPRPLRWLDPVHSYFGAHVSHHLFPQAPPKYARAIEAKIQELFPDRYHVMSLPKALKALWDTPWVYADRTTLIDPRTERRSGTLGHGLRD